jgi:hypothetical protein
MQVGMIPEPSPSGKKEKNLKSCRLPKRMAIWIFDRRQQDLLIFGVCASVCAPSGASGVGALAHHASPEDDGDKKGNLPNCKVANLKSIFVDSKPKC